MFSEKGTLNVTNCVSYEMSVDRMSKLILVGSNAFAFLPLTFLHWCYNGEGDSYVSCIMYIFNSNIFLL